MKAVALASTLAVLATVATATVGGDISQEYGTSTFQCTRNEGWDFMMTRSYRNYGAVDPAAAPNIRNAKAGGIPYTDVYHFPCSFGQSAAAQVASDINAVGRIFGTMWFDIETNPDSRCAWRSDKEENCKFLGELISAGHANGIKMGVYASVYMWESIMGSCTVGSSLPLWYAHYDGRKTFSDYTRFGGWSKPSIKQYGDSVGICGINADADWY
eukprot:TRINITY_DN12929_c0_g1_i2.p1 TRINITY_DN12929_c0_g1~~TRINITY_DN12929_c0_g1_i2.p1  ORF type:complete len:214 (+),score=67.30 TRINITY_DN12929_c0_g1_i2:188-829(+)